MTENPATIKELLEENNLDKMINYLEENFYVVVDKLPEYFYLARPDDMTLFYERIGKTKNQSNQLDQFSGQTKLSLVREELKIYLQYVKDQNNPDCLEVLQNKAKKKKEEKIKKKGWLSQFFDR